MLIGLVGRKRSGKDTIGDYLVIEKKFVKYNFANPLKRGIMEMFGFTEEQLFGDTKDVIDPVWGVTPRLVLQVIGTEVFQYDLQKYIPEFQSVGRTFWVERFKQWYNDNQNLNIVICDVRFQHEVDSILKMGGQVWKIERPSLISSDEHTSEIEMDKIFGVTRIIQNDGTLNELYNKVNLFF